ncbi:MAG: YraN family protein [Planctomycetales bacterium 71-10]|nr:MAG: YraN family protein [Planctomycetales bacterium 71-10]
MNPVLRALIGRLLGDRGERAAVAHLKRRGMRILRRNYRTKHGEVDAIARDGDVVVFVEVKARRRGDPAEAVTREKQRRLTLAALHFLKRHRLLEHRCRFDVVAVLWPADDGPPIVEHYPDAFEAHGRGQMFR